VQDTGSNYFLQQSRIYFLIPKIVKAINYFFMKKNFFLKIALILIFINSIIGYSQPITWYRTWGLPGYNRGEEGVRVCQTFDGGYAVLSLVGRGGDTWFDLLKYDYLGNLLWVNVIIDSTVTNRQLCDMQQTSDSGFIFTGWLPAGQGALLVKTDKNGNLKWQRNYTNLNSGERFYSVQQIKDKGYITCGDYIDYVNPSTKGIVTKVDSLGYVQWEKWYMDSLFNGYSNIIQGFDGNYYIAGGTSTNQPVISYSLLKKLDTLGNVLNTNLFYSNGSAAFLVQLKDSSLILGSEDVTTQFPIISKFFPSGALKWLKIYDIPSPNKFYFYYLCQDLKDNIIMTGGYDKYTYSTILNWKLDTGGTILKLKEIDYSGYSMIGAECIKSTIDSGYIITGSITLSGNNDALIIKTDSAFNSIIISGIQNIYYSVPENFKIYKNYPNPFNSSTLIKFYIPKNGIVNIVIYDILGKEIFSNKEYIYKGLNNKIINMSNMNLSSGIYFLRINFESNSEFIRLVYLK
jgi:hypothetical protein